MTVIAVVLLPYPLSGHHLVGQLVRLGQGVDLTVGVDGEGRK
jgi:hypothetical protein